MRTKLMIALIAVLMAIGFGIPMKAEAVEVSPVMFTVSVTTTTVQVNASGPTDCFSLKVKAHADNPGPVYLDDSSGTASTNGYPLNASDTEELNGWPGKESILKKGIINTQNFYASGSSSVTSSKLSFICLR